MINIFVCRNCGSLFEEPDYYLERHGLDTPPYEHIDMCPVCKSSDIAETFQCALCGEYIISQYIQLSNGLYICSDCYTENEI